MNRGLRECRRYMTTMQSAEKLSANERAQECSLCRNVFALIGMIVGFIISHAVEAIRPRLLPSRGAFAAVLAADASTAIVASGCMAPAVWAAWGPGRVVSRLAVTFLATAWIFIIWPVGMRL